jgi:hypothetical protein
MTNADTHEARHGSPDAHVVPLGANGCDGHVAAVPSHTAFALLGRV